MNLLQRSLLLNMARVECDLRYPETWKSRYALRTEFRGIEVPVQTLQRTR